MGSLQCGSGPRMVRWRKQLVDQQGKEGEGNGRSALCWQIKVAGATGSDCGPIGGLGDDRYYWISCTQLASPAGPVGSLNHRARQHLAAPSESWGLRTRRIRLPAGSRVDATGPRVDGGGAPEDASAQTAAADPPKPSYQMDRSIIIHSRRSCPATEKRKNRQIRYHITDKTGNPPTNQKITVANYLIEKSSILESCFLSRFHRPPSSPPRDKFPPNHPKREQSCIWSPQTGTKTLLGACE
jgi:hypothetical protein